MFKFLKKYDDAGFVNPARERFDHIMGWVTLAAIVIILLGCLIAVFLGV